MSGQPPVNRNPGYNAPPYNPKGTPNWGLQPFAQLNQTLQELVQAVFAILQHFLSQPAPSNELTMVGDVVASGPLSSPVTSTVAKIQGVPVSAASPTADSLMKYDAVLGAWVPSNDLDGGIF